MFELIVLVLGSITAAFAGFHWLWRRQLFSPVYYAKRDAFHLYPERFRALDPVRDGVVLEGIVFEPETPTCTVLYFGGKEQDSVALVGKLSERFPLWRIIAFNYRGYGRSGGRPSEKLLLGDAAFLAHYVKERYGKISVMGYSLGASVAAFAASRTAVERLVLVAPFYDAHSVAKAKLPLLPGWSVPYRFDTAGYLGGVDAPVAIFASAADSVVPVVQARALSAKAPRLEVYKEYSGYNHAEILGSESFIADVSKVC